MKRQRTEKADKQPDKKTTERRVPLFLQRKLVVFFCLILLVFIGLCVRLLWIEKENKEIYQKKILSQQKYDSITLPYRRGSILDSNGNILAISEKVYNLILDARVMSSRDGQYLEPTLTALESCFPQLNMSEVRTYIESNPGSSYYVPLKRLTYVEISNFVMLQNDTGFNEDKSAKPGNSIRGVWFEEEYRRKYPNGTVACDAIGFTTSDGIGMYGLEEYYNEELSGTNGREYGYLNTDENLERTTKPAENGNTLVSTIDLNIQKVVERYLKEFDEECKNQVREGNGANNTGCIVMEVDTGKILAMASYPVFDLNSPYDLSAYYSPEEIETMKNDNTQLETLNGIWKNFCISDTYEPGSTYKPFTIAMGLETGKLTENASYECKGFLEVGNYKIKCHNRWGDGIVNLKKAIASSCNVALMKASFEIGSETFAEYQRNFNFGLKTNIDLAGEARTAELLYTAEKMGNTELATGSFGQTFNVNMIQMISGFCSLINGGYYYEPHMVEQIKTSGGAVIKNIEPRVIKQTISESTSDLIREYCNAVCDVNYSGNTGKSARPAGYAIGGKTGTAQTLPRGNGEYVVSFIGYAPADHPKVAVYTVIDRPNMKSQSTGTKYATAITRSVLTDILPYLGIYMTEELSAAEQEELAQKKLEDTRKYAPLPEEEEEEKEEGQAAENTKEEEKNQPWKSFEKDPATGYLKDPNTGELLDPETGDSISKDYEAIPGE